MTTKRLTGGQAFPYAGDGFGSEGMTLLDYFAGQAMIALIQSLERFNSDQLAYDAYDIAREMLEARGEDDE